MKCLINGSWAVVTMVMMVSVLAIAEPPLESNDAAEKAVCKAEQKKLKVAGIMSKIDENGNIVEYAIRKLDPRMKDKDAFKALPKDQQDTILAAIHAETFKPENRLDVSDLLNEGGTHACWGWGWGWYYPMWSFWGWRSWCFWW